MAKIKTFEAACKLLKINSTDLPVVKHLPKIHQLALIAHYKLIIIAQVLNDGWQPNWSDDNERKYFPYFGVKADPKHPAGVGFSGTRATVTGARFRVSARAFASKTVNWLCMLVSNSLNFTRNTT